MDGKAQSLIVKRIQEICNEFDSYAIKVGVPVARLSLAKALAEAEAALAAARQEEREFSNIRAHKINEELCVVEMPYDVRLRIGDLLVQIIDRARGK